MKLLFVGAAAWLLLAACSDESGNGSAGTTGSGAGTSAGGQTATGGSSTGAGATSGAGATGGASSGAGGTGGSSQGCADLSPPTGSMTESITVASEMRSYELSVPASYDPGTPLPLVFAWHGRGGDGALAKLYFGVEGQANGAAIFVYPDGLNRDGNGSGWDLATNGNDVALFDAILSDLSERYCIDDTRIFSTGHSFGGYFSNTLGCARADVLRAIAPVAGGGPFGGGCSGALAAWITHGSGDSVVPLSQGQGSRDHWRGENGCDATSASVTPSPCVAYDNCTAGAELHWCEHNGGHEWPSFAASAIWTFFASMQ